ncbi:MAG: response regulator transcription factor [Opitutales bacterium]|nr:response regulator transcription factor [Opitutales bacterium]
MRILMVDDHAIARKGLRSILENGFKQATFGEAENSTEALQKIQNHEWDLVVLDMSMPGRNGLEVLKEVKAFRPNLPVLVLSMHPEDQYAVRVIKSGAAGYITKDSAPDDLVRAVRKVLAGGRYISRALAEEMAAYITLDARKPAHEMLSDREFQVLLLIASGRTVSEIGVELSLSVKTISTYRARILEKMAMRTNAELTEYAIRNKLVGR